MIKCNFVYVCGKVAWFRCYMQVPLLLCVWESRLVFVVIGKSPGFRCYMQVPLYVCGEVAWFRCYMKEYFRFFKSTHLK